MNIEKFKQILKFKTAGGLKLPTEDEEYDILIEEAINGIANKVVPNVLIETEYEAGNVLRWLTDTHFIRKPKITSQNSGEIDIDEALSYAVVYSVARMFVKDTEQKLMIEQEYKSVLVDFIWIAFDLIKENNDDDCETTE